MALEESAIVAHFLTLSNKLQMRIWLVFQFANRIRWSFLLAESEPYYGTNPIAFAAPGKNGEHITFDMATTVQAWGKILHARSKNDPIPDTWAVDSEGEPTTDPFKVNALVPIAGPKGYGLMMMVDVFPEFYWDFHLETKYLPCTMI